MSQEKMGVPTPQKMVREEMSRGEEEYAELKREQKPQKINEQEIENRIKNIESFYNSSIEHLDAEKDSDKIKEEKYWKEKNIAEIRIENGDLDYGRKALSEMPREDNNGDNTRWLMLANTLAEYGDEKDLDFIKSGIANIKPTKEHFGAECEYNNLIIKIIEQGGDAKIIRKYLKKIGVGSTFHYEIFKSLIKSGEKNIAQEEFEKVVDCYQQRGDRDWNNADTVWIVRPLINYISLLSEIDPLYTKSILEKKML